MPDRKITILAENTAGGRGLLAEHGLSFWMELGQTKVLFDTGQGQVLNHNARCLGIQLESVNSIVLSHGHYDHTGGLSGVLPLAGHTRVYVHPHAFDAKYARNADGSAREVGMDETAKRDVCSKADPIWVNQPMEIDEGLWVTGPIPRMNSYEDTGGAFFRDADCREPDAILDDQAAFLETGSGTVVILGCAHSGVINTLHHIRSLTANRPIHTVIGGMHLLHASPQRMRETIEELRRLKIQRLMPCHCTGFAAMAQLEREFPSQFEACSVGASLQFDG